MKILIISTNADESGAPIHVLSIVESLHKIFSLILIFGEQGNIERTIRSKENIPVYIIPAIKSAISPFKDIAALYKILCIIIREQPNLIHAHSSKAGMLARIASLITGTPCVYTVHGWGWRGLSPIKYKMVVFIERILKYVPQTIYICVSNSVAAEARTIVGIRNDSLRVIYNGVKDMLTNTSNYNNVLTFIMPARVCDAKDHETLLRAFALFDKPSRLILCGSGTDKVEFVSRASEITGERFKDIVFLGVRSDIADLLNKSHVFLLISKYEALPLSIIEAMSTELAIIATKVGGVEELLDDNVSGILVNSGDVDFLVDAMNKVNSVKLRTRLGKNARRKYISNFNESLMSQKIIEVYSSHAHIRRVL
jgi:glycosyltransferase involved in cell wall biosynthesis